ncbi:hypothetical protein C8J57DRAFT_1334608 [Mycena rebaudengoi]|nr:hypothetical protein C8J57DRAFT_1334608 [Mycena rebaudengoi]
MRLGTCTPATLRSPSSRLRHWRTSRRRTLHRPRRNLSGSWTFTPSLSGGSATPPPNPRWTSTPSPSAHPGAWTTPLPNPRARRPPTSRTLTLCSSSCSTRSSPRTPHSGRLSGTASVRSPQDGRRQRDFLRGVTPASTPPSTPSARAPRCSARRASASSTSARASSCGVRGSG